MKIYLFIFLTLSLFISCNKDVDSDSGTTTTGTTNESNDGTGEYSGIIYSTLTKTPLGTGQSCWIYEVENSSSTVTVSITKIGETYYLDGMAMSGSGNTFTLSNNGNYVLNVSQQTIQYSRQSSWTECYKSNCSTCTDYLFESNSNGVLSY